MWGTLISAGAGLVGGLIGANKAKKARQAQQREINNQSARNETWYNSAYYQPYMESSMAKAAMKRVEDTMSRSNRNAQAQAAVTGATPEAVIAQQQANNAVMADTVENLAARADARKDSIDAQHNNMQQQISAQRMQQYQADEAGGSQLMNNGFGLLGQALSIAGNSTGRVDSSIPTADEISSFRDAKVREGIKQLDQSIAQKKANGTLF